MVESSAYYEGIRAEVAEFIPQKYSKVLEIGCGKGGFRANASDNCEYWGVEPNEEVANIAKTKLNKVIIGTFDDAFNDLPDNYFDLVICNDVIEHMVDHHMFYNRIKAKCAKDACMIGSIPNVRYIRNLYDLLIKKDWKYTEEGILDKTHLRFFTLKSIKQDFLKHQFKTEKLCGINKVYFSKRKLSNLKIMLLQLFLGEDTRFLQFGFRVKLK
ncbi:class I SAM-dependent methyltransferase [Sulfurimonas sp.]|uniref:class I SAM-dependent methyltransferase n=1 Tax=Sulfurimonas sp. TaxID=2022749 RepID=UPI001A0CA62C|nr:class I SAM-dependent methyltransferase [Sulfurimonas sp.]MBE0515558.1 class I SAM-dependent methyltransferase [Sulfurimonas sp.]